MVSNALDRSMKMALTELPLPKASLKFSIILNNIQRLYISVAKKHII